MWVCCAPTYIVRIHLFRVGPFKRGIVVLSLYGCFFFLLLLLASFSHFSSFHYFYFILLFFSFVALWHFITFTRKNYSTTQSNDVCGKCWKKKNCCLVWMLKSNKKKYCTMSEARRNEHLLNEIERSPLKLNLVSCS